MGGPGCARNHRRFGLAIDRVTIGPVQGAILTVRNVLARNLFGTTNPH
jgi:hypothetical protein